MFSIGIGEIQKNTSLFNNITQSFQIVDKRKKQVLALVHPVKKHSMTKKLAGKYKNKADGKLSIHDIKNSAMMDAMKEKYDLSY